MNILDLVLSLVGLIGGLSINAGTSLDGGRGRNFVMMCGWGASRQSDITRS